nr:MAG TPA: hypothetical protein [Caudoviricetes sp.]
MLGSVLPSGKLIYKRSRCSRTGGVFYCCLILKIKAPGFSQSPYRGGPTTRGLLSINET